MERKKKTDPKTKFVSFVFIALILFSALSGIVSAGEFVDESDALSETLCCDGSISGSKDSSTPNSLNLNNSLSSEIDRFLNANKPVFLFFHTDKRHYCDEQKPIIDELEQEYADKVAFIRVNAKENLQALEEFGVTGFPAMFLIVDKNKEGYVYQEFNGLAADSELSCHALKNFIKLEEEQVSFWRQEIECAKGEFWEDFSVTIISYVPGADVEALAITWAKMIKDMVESRSLWPFFN